MTSTSIARPAPPRVPTPPERAAGVVLAAGLGLVAWASGRKPLHAVGRTWDAELRIDAPAAHLGVPLLVDRGVHPCTVRVSRAMSTRPGCWDVGGLAVRLPAAGTSGGAADLLLASTGTGRVSRYVLRPVRWAASRSMTTLLPTRAGEHSLALLARPRGDEVVPREYELAASLDGGPWRAVGLLQLLLEQADAAMRFDPIVNELAGTSPPAWVVAVREPAYRWARRLGRRHA